ncbi:hypothetical protein ABAC460_13310 [Asticcacaulis sp. AC460]|uniref:calcium-binding protein n=1 Tax=Asticcacaulis sp. AC460 TaxID=1282360 RepID=UPI0003C3D332|nr:calcium-binding protein [Asticcacaulis sp. AC460]ESQ89267.1 hypothetical protein ABAC460_13310 [Asticcacaulis sp. AC460]
MTSVLNIENETRVNTYTTGDQTNCVVTRLSNGGYVVVWESYAQDGDGGGIYFQRYDANGVALGSETRANSVTAGAQSDPAVVAMAGGGFVITWSSFGQDDPNFGVQARIYSTTGSAAGTEFLVNTTTANTQYSPDLAALSDGGFVAVWQSTLQDGDGIGVYAQRYSANGLTLGGETRINTFTTGDQSHARATGLTGGGYVVTWTSDGQDGSGDGVYARVYTGGGAAVTAEFRVNTRTTDSQAQPDVAALEAGGFVVVWTSNLQDGSSYGVYCRLYNADGTAAGSEARVNTYVTGTQNVPAVTALTDGGYVVAWQSGQDGDAAGVYAQRYDAQGRAIGPELQVNTYIIGGQTAPDVVALDDGGFAVTWLSPAQDGSGFGIYRKEFSAAASLTGTQLLYGTADADTLDGGSGADKMYGGFGDDLYIVNSTSDLVSERSSQGDDEVRSSVTWTLGSYVENLTLTGAAGLTGTGNTLDNIITGNAGNNYLNGAAGDDQINGGTGHDQIFGGDGEDYLEGHTGNDTLRGQDGHDDLFGGDGSDSLDGGVGHDNIDGGSGHDTLFGDEGDDLLDGGTGNDVLRFSAGYNYADGGSGTDTMSAELYEYAVVASLADENMYDALGNSMALYGIEHLRGSAFGDDLVGNAASNQLDGGLGADTLAGLGGNDTYLVDHVGDSVWEAAGQGTDLVRAWVSFSLEGTQVENLILQGTGHLVGIGNGLNNQLTGNTGDNRLDGGSGNDTLSGGAGNDTYVVDTLSDIIIEGATTGVDEVRSDISYVLGANLENLILVGVLATSGTGNAANNVITGFSQANSLDGGGGDDTLIGGAGNDTYDIDSELDSVVELLNQGIDTVRVAFAGYQLADNVENLILTAPSGNAVGNPLDNVITGSEGNNFLNGHFGVDTLIGGLGDDSYRVDEAGEVVTELNGQGNDIIFTHISFSLAGTYVETLTITGIYDVSATGNGEANSLNGATGNNVLDGGGGADTMNGGQGNDTFYVDHIGDNVIEAAGEGTDQVFSSVTYSLVGRNAEHLTLTGNAIISAAGNGLGNQLTGNSAGNTLNGGGGNDTLTGGLGADYFQFGAAFRADTVTDFNSGQGDKIQLVGLGSYTVTQVGANVTVDFGGGNIITVLTSTAADVSANII